MRSQRANIKTIVGAISACLGHKVVFLVGQDKADKTETTRTRKLQWVIAGFGVSLHLCVIKIFEVGGHHGATYAANTVLIQRDSFDHTFANLFETSIQLTLNCLVILLLLLTIQIGRRQIP